MSGPAVVIREAHRLRRYAADLQEQINRFPIQLKAQQTRVTRQEEAQRDGVETLKKLKVTVHEHEVTLKTTHTQIKKHEKQLDEAGSKKEYDALRQEIDADKAKVQQLEEEILNGMGEIDERTAKLPDLEKAVKDARAEFARWEKTTQEKLVMQKDELAKALTRLKEVEGQLHDKFRDTYKRMVGAKGPDAFAAVSGRTCGGCGTEITAQNLNELKSGVFFVCRSCERMLYLPDEGG
jgi:predicted  nucleic acid-binding Zn-ribbon protein